MDDLLLQEIGKRILSRRKQLGYTQEQIADKMNVSIQMISNLERGIKAIRIDNLIKLSQILEISTDFILTGKESTVDLCGLTAKVEQLAEKDQRMIKMLIEFCISEQN